MVSEIACNFAEPFSYCDINHKKLKSCSSTQRLLIESYCTENITVFHAEILNSYPFIGSVSWNLNFMFLFEKKNNNFQSGKRRLNFKPPLRFSILVK